MSEIPATGFYPAVHKQSDIPGRTTRICYANNDTVPPEKRGKEISDADYKKLTTQRLGAVKALKAPKASTLKEMCTAFEKWIERYTSKPKRYNPNKIEQNINTALDIVDGAVNPNHKQQSDTPNQLNLRS